MIDTKFANKAADGGRFGERKKNIFIHAKCEGFNAKNKNTKQSIRNLKSWAAKERLNEDIESFKPGRREVGR